jgi:hypothetical protein
MDGNPITSAFAAASATLGFPFEPSFSVTLRDGSVVQSLGLVRNFGSQLGTLLFGAARQPSERELRELEAEGYFCSALFESYHAFARQHFEDTLNDWGFYGEAQERPAWYSGAAWSR